MRYRMENNAMVDCGDWKWLWSLGDPLGMGARGCYHTTTEAFE